MRIVGQEQVASLFGVAPKTIVEWQEAGFPVALRGSPGIPSEYESDACINWLIAREVRKACTETPSDRLARVKADQIEMANMKERGLLIPAAEIEPRMTGAIIAARERLRGDAGPLARRTVGKTSDEVEAMLTETFDAFLSELSRWNQDDLDDDEDEQLEGDDE